MSNANEVNLTELLADLTIRRGSDEKIVTISAHAKDGWAAFCRHVVMHFDDWYLVMVTLKNREDNACNESIARVAQYSRLLC